ncbi:MAG: polyprenyl diphosphate synthase [Nanoarchaeota archaeon]
MSEATTENLHIAMIMDGNRRFAKRLKKEPWNGHRYGAKKLEEVLKWCKEQGIRTLTVFSFSLQNLNRPQEEFDFLMDLFRESFDKIKRKGSKIQKHNIKINILGRTEIFPDDIQQSLAEVKEQTRDNDLFTLNMCFGYGGREEIVDATRALAQDVKEGKVDAKDIDENLLDSYMYSSDKPDLIIRTGGEHRTSNFLPWQSAYSEWFFVDTMWPEFSKKEFIAILDQYKKRDRRFGK